MYWNWGQLRRELRIWQKSTLPGLTVLTFVILARTLGLLQGMEWAVLDTFLRFRPAETTDERIVIVGIDEKDIEEAKSYPIPDAKIAQLLTKLESYQPSAIGLDLFKNVPVEPGSKKLIQVFKQNKNIIGMEKILHPKVAPPPYLTEEQVGFVDVLPDLDGKSRRYLLWAATNPQQKNEDRDSLATQLVSIYLSEKGKDLETGIRDPNTMRFGAIELPKFHKNTGGYVKADDGGLQVLMNFRTGKEPFRIFSLRDVLSGNLNPAFFREKIILIGNRSPSAGDFIYTSAIAHQEQDRNKHPYNIKNQTIVESKIITNQRPYGQIYGVEYHAHAISQIISRVIDKRPMLETLDDWQEYIWIISWGIVPIIIGRITQSVWKNLLGVGVAGIFLLSSGYICLLFFGIWIPVAPNLLNLAINSVGLSAFAFYQHDRLLQSKLEEREKTIEETFRIIHNGPLQTLAYALSHLRVQDLPNEELAGHLETLNYEIREIGEYLKIEALTQEESLRLGSGSKLDLRRPIHELFYEVYTKTLERKDLEYLKTLKGKIRTFDPIDDRFLNIEQKRELCQFLEEALCNVGKHARGVKRIQASGTITDRCYTLLIQDNGCGIVSPVENKGTKQCRSLAKKLGGHFKRESRVPSGTLCELTWLLIPNYSSSHSIQEKLKTWFFK
jgi:CHASE2 domain-containing sensor protein